MKTLKLLIETSFFNKINDLNDPLTQISRARHYSTFNISNNRQYRFLCYY